MEKYKVNNRPVSIKATARKYYIRVSQIKMYKARMNKTGSVDMSASDTVEKRCDFPQKQPASPREIYGASSTFLTSENEYGSGTSASETGAMNPEDYAVSKSNGAARVTVTNGRRLAKAAYRKNVIKRRSVQHESINMDSGQPIADILVDSKDQARIVDKRESKKEMVDSLRTNRSRYSAEIENTVPMQADKRTNEIKSEGRKYAKGKILKEDDADSKLTERKHIKSMPKVNFSESKRSNSMKYKDAALKYARKSYFRAAVSFDTKKYAKSLL